MASSTVEAVNGVPNNGAQSDELPILIIGSGSTGLALAQGLSKAGIRCTVFEKQPSRARERDWNMGLHWGAPSLLSLMPSSWHSRIQSLQVDPHVPTKDEDTLSFIKGDDGKTLAAFTLGPFYRLKRSKLRELMSQELDVQYSKRLSNISYAQDGKSITAHFDDGTHAMGRLLVGADGARSTTRRILLGPEVGAVNELPYVATFTQCRFTADQAKFLRSFHPLYLASAHPGNKFAFFGIQDIPDPNDPSTWLFFYYISRPSSKEEQEATKDWSDKKRLEEVKALAKDWCDPWRSAYEWTPDSNPVWHMALSDWDPGMDNHTWDNHDGLVTMAGDACHPMTYQRGQGLNHSMTDAGKLRDAIVKIVKEGANQKHEVDGFEKEMVERGGKEVRDGTANTRLLHDWDKVRESPFFNKGMKKE